MKQSVRDLLDDGHAHDGASVAPVVVLERMWILIFLFSILLPLMILGSYGTVVSNIPGY